MFEDGINLVEPGVKWGRFSFVRESLGAALLAPWLPCRTVWARRKLESRQPTPSSVAAVGNWREGGGEGGHGAAS